MFSRSNTQGERTAPISPRTGLAQIAIIGLYARNRTIDKSRRAIRNALLPYLNSPVLVNPKTGYLAEIEIKKYQNVVKNILSTMEGNSEISGYSVLVSSNQNILLT